MAYDQAWRKGGLGRERSQDRLSEKHMSVRAADNKEKGSQREIANDTTRVRKGIIKGGKIPGKSKPGQRHTWRIDKRLMKESYVLESG